MNKYILFISYDGLLDPLGQSQILPYIFGLNNYGYKFIILSYEKERRSETHIQELRKELNSKGIIWFRLSFVRGRIRRIIRILSGANKVRYINKKYDLGFIHLRALQPALIFWVSLINKPFIYDMRAFAGQWIDMGAVRKDSILAKIIIYFEKLLVKKASRLVVLDDSGSKYLNTKYKTNKQYEVIPTSTDLGKYIINKENKLNGIRIYRFVFLGGARYPYLPQKALIFIMQLMKNGYNCEVDFINESDQEYILKACKEIGFPRDKLNLFSVARTELYKILPSYDCGLAFIATGTWLRMCSPTKIGEYLAAGLHIVGLEGLAVLDRLAQESNSVDLIETKGNNILLSKEKSMKIINKINDPMRKLNARRIAKERYDLNQALKKYKKLYLGLLLSLEK
tara:strand:- start:401 stop:1591 length:1191 start_codon:yes stop_codon:yes gene_type:complete